MCGSVLQFEQNEYRLKDVISKKVHNQTVLQMTRKNTHYFLLANKYASWGRNKCMTWNLFNFIFFYDTDTRIPFVRHFVSTGLTHLKHSYFKTCIHSTARTKEHYGNYTLTNQNTAFLYWVKLRQKYNLINQYNIIKFVITNYSDSLQEKFCKAEQDCFGAPGIGWDFSQNWGFKVNKTTD